MNGNAAVKVNMRIRCTDARDGSLVWDGEVPNTITRRGLNELAQCIGSTQSMQSIADMSLMSGSNGTGTYRQTQSSVSGSKAGTVATFQAVFGKAGSAFDVGSVRVHLNDSGKTILAQANLSAITKTTGHGTAMPTRKETHHIWTIQWAVSVSVTTLQSTEANNLAGQIASLISSTSRFSGGLTLVPEYSDGSNLPGWGGDTSGSSIALPSDSATSTVITMQSNITSVDVGGTYDVLVREGTTPIHRQSNVVVVAGDTGTVQATLTLTS